MGCLRLQVPPIPSEHTKREEVALIMYLGTAEECGGSTAFVYQKREIVYQKRGI